MRYIKVVVTLFSFCITSSIFATSITPVMLKTARAAVYGWIDEYLEYSYLTSDYDIRRYGDLFKSDTVWVVNDYLPLTTDRRIQVETYKQLYSDTDRFYNTEMKVSEPSIRLLKEYVGPNHYSCTLSMMKSVYFFDDKRKYEYPSKDYTYIVDLEYDFHTGRIFCTNISSQDSLAVEYVLHQSSDSVYNTYVNESKAMSLLENNENLPIIISKSIYHNSFDYKMIEIKRDTLRYAFHLGGNIGCSFYSPSISSDDFSYSGQNGGLTWGINFGFYHQCFLKNNSRLGVDYSILYSEGNYSILGNYAAKYNAVDADGGEYVRIMKADAFQEKVKLYEMIVPITLRYDYFIKPNFTIFARLGAYVSYCFKQTSNISAHSEYAGYYDWLFDVTMDQNGIYDFGKYDYKGQLEQTALGKLNIGVNIAIGCQYFIPNTHLSIEPSVMFQTSIYAPLKKQSGFYLTEKNGEFGSATNYFESIFKQNVSLQLNLNYHF